MSLSVGASSPTPAAREGVGDRLAGGFREEAHHGGEAGIEDGGAQLEGLEFLFGEGLAFEDFDGGTRDQGQGMVGHGVPLGGETPPLHLAPGEGDAAVKGVLAGCGRGDAMGGRLGRRVGEGRRRRCA